MAPLHVLVAGAGPCGLLVAHQLQSAGVRCTVLERAPEERLEADVGSGYDLSPTSSEILRRAGLGSRLGGSRFPRYDAMCVATMGGEAAPVRVAPLSERQHAGYYAARRSDLQRSLRDALREGAASAGEAAAALVCGVQVTGFEEDEHGVAVEFTRVQQQPAAGEAAPAAAAAAASAAAGGGVLRGDVLLGCDGVHSAVRKGMHSSAEQDRLRFCGAVTWWGNTEVRRWRGPGPCSEASPSAPDRMQVRCSDRVLSRPAR